MLSITICKSSFPKKQNKTKKIPSPFVILTIFVCVQNCFTNAFTLLCHSNIHATFSRDKTPLFPKPIRELGDTVDNNSIIIKCMLQRTPISEAIFSPLQSSFLTSGLISLHCNIVLP